MKSFAKLSAITLVLIGLVLSIYRLNHVRTNEFSWDVLGYYMPLPATFIHGDLLLKDISWLEQQNEEKDLTATFYTISKNQDREPMYLFLFGMAILYLPFFFMGHGIALITSFPPDGFSEPYVYALVIGSIFYTLLGLFYLRKILKHYFSELITTIVLLIVVFGTNYIHHMTVKNLETVNYLFPLLTLVIWQTIKWHQSHKLKNMLALGVAITFMGMIKPTEVLVLFIPLLWNVNSKDSLKAKFKLLLEHKKQLISTVVLCALVSSPQWVYWLYMTGSPIYDSYYNPGIGLDLLSPYIWESLFSFRKGWLIYTPIIIFCLVGFYFWYRKKQSNFLPLFFYFVCSFYIITSWTEWWYGAGFSNRPLLVTYPILAIALGHFLSYLKSKKTVIQGTVVFVMLAFCFMNHFYYWQFKNYILDPYRGTKEYFFATFLKTSVTPEDKELLLVKRDFGGENKFENREQYQQIFEDDFTEEAEKYESFKDTTGSLCYNLASADNFYFTNAIPYKELTDKDHLWVTISLEVRYAEDYQDNYPCFVSTMNRKGGVYGYYAFALKPTADSTKSDWNKLNFEYLTPNVRNPKDELKYYIWKRGQQGFEVRNLSLKAFERKD